MISDRGLDGVLPRPTRLADESYLEFVEDVRKFAIQTAGPATAAAGEAAMQAGEAPASLQDIQAVYDDLPVSKAWRRLVRSQQEMMWRRTRQSFMGVADELMTEMRGAETDGPARLKIDPNFETPTYARREIHLQPGGYTDDPIGGLVFHYGTKVFYEGANDQDELHREMAEKMALPEDGQVRRILDIGCSIGQATTALKDLHPDAEVIGLDVGEPMVRYAHLRACRQNKDVTFVQALAEDMDFPDAHFDVVFSYILFHEVPVKVMKGIVEEVSRVLRPGGTFAIFEFPNNPGDSLPPFYRYLIDFDSRDNCEPYSPGFVNSDFRGILDAAGFDISDGPQTSNPFLQSLIGRKR